MTTPPPPAGQAPPSSDDFIDRELSWLSFNRRVLDEAFDRRAPLLERVKFMNIFVSNLDEFFMKRVGALNLRSVPAAGGTGEPPVMVLVRAQVLAANERFRACLNDIRPELKAQRIELVPWAELTREEVAFASEFFQKNVFPVLTPLSVDPGHPFPFISNLSTSFGILMRHPKRDWEELFGRVKIPEVFPSWFPLGAPAPGGVVRLASTLELVGHHLPSLFQGMEILDTMAFRVTRRADTGSDDRDQETDDLLTRVTDELKERRFGSVVRLEHGPRANPTILRILCEELEIGTNDVYALPDELQYRSLGAVTDLSRPDLKLMPWNPVAPEPLADSNTNIFDVIRLTDLLVHHPYESFHHTVERFIATAADDPKVIAVKMTLYRTGKDSPFLPHLVRAAEAGKQVAVLVELTASFDEERNIFIARSLEKAGVHVVYGVVGLKTHCKMALVVRQEGDRLRSYAHLGTGNYHARTAQQYTDLSYFTAKSGITEDVVHLFHSLTGRAPNIQFRKLLVAPLDMQTKVLALIERECAHAAAGKPARLVAQMNGLQDPTIITALYRASRAGVKVDLVVRGVCCLRPRVPGVSDNIRVFSVIGRFLEHSRIFHFRNGMEDPIAGDFYIGSADWMTRNLQARVEAATPIEDEPLRRKLWDVLTVLIEDKRQGWEMQSDGSYLRRSEITESGVGTHEVMMTRSRHRRGKR